MLLALFLELDCLDQALDLPYTHAHQKALLLQPKSITPEPFGTQKP